MTYTISFSHETFLFSTYYFLSPKNEVFRFCPRLYNWENLRGFKLYLMGQFLRFFAWFFFATKDNAS